MNTSEHTYRLATLDDLDVLLRMGERLFRVEKFFEPTLSFSLEKARKRYEEQLPNESAFFLIASSGQEDIGYLYAYLERSEHLEYTRPECHLEVVFVELEYRGQGIASQLVNRAIDWARSHNAFRLTSDVFAGNECSLQLLEHKGFHPHNITLVRDLE